MKREAILHIPMSSYAHGMDEEHVVFRLRAARGDLKRCRLFYGDRACRQTPVVFSGVDMTREAQDEWFDYFEVILKSPYRRICYYFELSDGKENTLYYADLFAGKTVAERSEYYQLPYNRREDIVDVPEWFKNAVVYNIFPDSFATSAGHISLTPCARQFGGIETRGKLGGTINGIRENLPYIRSLGANCIYINPIFAAGEYHKYDLIDYYTIDPCFGTNDDFKVLVDACHKMGMRIIIDGVFNHCGWDFFAFNDVVEKGEQSKYADWFYGLQFPVVKPDDPEAYPGYECFGYERLMPKLNTGNPEVRRYFLDVCTHWINHYDIDGWRLDVASEVDHDFWNEFRKAAKAAKPDCVLIGEVWESAGFWLDGSKFDSTMNYDFRKHCRDFFAHGSVDAAQFDGRITQMRMRYRYNVSYGQFNLLDSHDVPRFLSLCGGDIYKLKLAVLFQMTFIGPPSIFYGDEQGIEGVLESDYRSPMRFDEDGELLKHYRMAASLRNSHESLRRGTYATLHAAQNSGLYVFERRDSNERLVVALNAGVMDAELHAEWMDGELLMAQGLSGGRLDANGYAVVCKPV